MLFIVLLLTACDTEGDPKQGDTAPGDSDTTVECDPSFDISVLQTAYVLDAEVAEIVEPPGIGDLLMDKYIMLESLLLGVEPGADWTLDLMGATVKEDSENEQELCLPTAQIEGADFCSAPRFTGGPADIVFDDPDMPVNLYNAVVSGTFSDDGSEMAAGTCSFQLDCRETGYVIDGKTSGDDMCALMESFGTPCVECAHDGQIYCVDYRIEQIRADAVPGLQLQQADQISDEPECKKAVENCGCSSAHGTGAGALLLLSLGGLLLRRRRRRD